ncbi:UNVERIFIED_CONTAM: Receptor-like protein 2 [Sesamum angustifolium]|uniref:Receptor-like protein 2 n=1 Tax=Sesamum angustifolium TaxID=2727405 RepID=A0AAW2QQT7_9LAMI
MLSLDIFVFLLLFSSSKALCCNHIDHHSLLSFYHHIFSPSPLNWSSSIPCCQWEGVACQNYDNRVTRLSLPGRSLSGTLTPSLANLSFLSHLNLSRNHLSGPFPPTLFHSLNRFKTLDLSFNRFSGLLQPPESSGSILPVSIRTFDLSSNRFNGSLDSSVLRGAKNLISFNISNNSFSGPVPLLSAEAPPFSESWISPSINSLVVYLMGLVNVRIYRFSGQVLILSQDGCPTMFTE